MAGNRQIKIELGIDGEKQYNAALNEARRNLANLRSALKAETAELGVNATAQQKNQLRAASLKKQIAEQEKVVETYRKALEEIKKTYGDNEDLTSKWQRTLDSARASLGDMRNELASLGNEFRNVDSATAAGVVATKSFADALGDVASVGDSIAGAVENIFTGMVGAVRGALEEVWDMIGETAAKANNWTDIAGYWNTEPANVEKWARAVEGTANSFADFESIVSRIVLGGKNKEITELLGISDVNYEDQWDYAIAVLQQIYELRNSGNLPENVWETIFGEKKATKVMDILNDWESIQKGLTTYNADEGGFGLGEDALKEMAQLYETMANIEGKWKALKETFAHGLGTITADILVDVSGSLDALNAYLKADTEEERKDAMEKLRGHIESFFQKLRQALIDAVHILDDVGKEFQNSEDPMLKTIGDVLVGLANTMQWVIDNSDKVKMALEAIFGVWLLAKITAISAKVAALLFQLRTIQTFKGLSGLVAGAAGSGAGAAGGAGESATGSAVGSKVGAAVGGFWSSAKALAANSIATMTPASAAVGLSPAALIAGVVGGAKAVENWQRGQTAEHIASIAEPIYEVAENNKGEENLQVIADAASQMQEALSTSDPALVDKMVNDVLTKTDLDGVLSESVSERWQRLLNYDPLQSGDVLDQHFARELLEDMLVDMRMFVDSYGMNAGGSTGGTLTSEDISGFWSMPAQMINAVKKGVAEGVGSITIYMDSTKVGNAVAPTVGGVIAVQAMTK